MENTIQPGKNKKQNDKAWDDLLDRHKNNYGGLGDGFSSIGGMGKISAHVLPAYDDANKKPAPENEIKASTDAQFRSGLGGRTYKNIYGNSNQPTSASGIHNNKVMEDLNVANVDARSKGFNNAFEMQSYYNQLRQLKLNMLRQYLGGPSVNMNQSGNQPSLPDMGSMLRYNRG